MSKLVVENRPLIILPALACECGLNEAIVLQQIHYWLHMSKHIHDGYTWIYNTYADWQKQFPFWSVSTIKRTIYRLENEGYIVTGNYNKKKMDHTKWYRINYEKLSTLNSQLIQSEQEGYSNWVDEQVNVNTAIPEITTENTPYTSSTSHACKASSGGPSTVDEILLSLHDAEVGLIAAKFIELRAIGCVLTPLDYEGIKEILEVGVSRDNALKWLEECFQQYIPRHHRDRIRAFSYCVPYILDRHMESTRFRKKAAFTTVYNEEDFDLDD
ncbi:hypothetical protein [Priestia taiwanensis]|uniref:Replication protein n=1 Tax=Priestia taiwanensis TaxID=1347902 RepID=A0A917EKR9_9BACI|nr:hypothetical protein [Priestia taiwanensis]MBM7361916.1 hypothetical protein [Priestia taiwanensis]GGE57964.1 hypothetical protein GCM10007140_05430 [Priestia taiwanensis]